MVLNSMSLDDANGDSDIPGWYMDKTILITGATGFLGKVLVERILSTCPGKKMYLLLRTKKGRCVKERLEDFLNCQVFDKLRDTYPERLNSVVAIRGDINSENLGISEEDSKVLKNTCNVIFHCAANVKFDQKLKDAVLTNTLGTRKVLTLAKEFKSLDVFIHVSTAYSHCKEEILEEIGYTAPHPPDKIIDMVSWMDQEMQDSITPRLLDGLPNTYAYSKSLSEQLVIEHHKYFPVVLTRPSIVVASWRDPMPGWIENLNGPTGLMVGAGKGVIRSMHCNEQYLADIMPVDMCCNAIIALGWKMGLKKYEEPLICNVTESGANAISWGKCLEYGRKHIYDYPFSILLWYPGGSIKANYLMHKLAVIFFHYMPAYFIDFLLLLLRKKPFLVKTQKRISGGLEVLQYYTVKEWKFMNKVYLQIPKWLSEKDRETYPTNTRLIDWNSFMKDYILGAREFCCKDDPTNLPKARSTLKKLYYLDIITSILIYSFILWAIWFFSPLVLSGIESGLNSITGLIK